MDRANFVLLCLMMLGCAAKPVVVERPPELWQRPDVRRAMVEPVDDPAVLCPADARLYLRVNDLAGWRQSGTNDRAVEHVWSIIESLNLPDVWQRAQSQLGYDDARMADAVFGSCAMVVVQRIDGRDMPVILTRVDQQVLTRLPRAAGMQSWGRTAAFGPYRLYRCDTEHGQIAAAFGKRWMAVTGANEVDALRRLLCATASGIAPMNASDDYRTVANALPGDHDVLLISRKADGSLVHGVTVRRSPGADRMDYAAHGSGLAQLDERYVLGDGVNFGLLPDSAAAAVSFNAIERGRRLPAALNMVTFPRSFNRHVLGRLLPSVVLFIGDASSGAPGEAMQPALGAAVRMRDPRVAADLDKLVAAAHLLATLGEVDVMRMLFGIRRESVGDYQYRVADFGDAIARRANDSAVAEMLGDPSTRKLTHLTFGPISDWYVICTNEAMYRQCIAAADDASRRLVQTDDYAQMRFDTNRQWLLANVMMRANKLEGLFEGLAERWHHSALAKTHTPYDQPLSWLIEGLANYHWLRCQVWRSDDDELRGEMLVRKVGATSR
jgi:hypothetical protein